jgi:putative transposase
MEKQILLSESSENEYERGKHSVGISMWHFEWCSKYRYKMFAKDKYKNLIAACIRKAATLHKIRIIELAIQPEHVHCVVAISLTMSPAFALQILKGLSSKLFFENHEKAKLRYPKNHLWSPGKFASSLGFIQLDVAKNYVINQEEHHSGSLGL